MLEIAGGMTTRLTMTNLSHLRTLRPTKAGAGAHRPTVDCCSPVQGHSKETHEQTNRQDARHNSESVSAPMFGDRALSRSLACFLARCLEVRARARSLLNGVEPV